MEWGREIMKSPHKCPPSIHFKPSVDLLAIVGYFTYKCKTDWAIESEMVIGYEIPSALAAWRARRRGPLFFSLHCHIMSGHQQVRLYRVFVHSGFLIFLCDLMTETKEEILAAISLKRGPSTGGKVGKIWAEQSHQTCFNTATRGQHRSVVWVNSDTVTCIVTICKRKSEEWLLVSFVKYL